jgi:hypothetical protein
VLRLEAGEAELRVVLDQPPPAKLPLTLVLALPRPKMLRRVFQTVATMGVPRVILVNSYRVEKSFWQTPFLEPDAIREQLILGLEQARDSVLPEIVIEKRFKPFVEDRLPAISEGTLGLVGHPGNFPPCPRGINEPVTLAIGPEGGWIPYEIDLLAKSGLQPVQLGRPHPARRNRRHRPARPPLLTPQTSVARELAPAWARSGHRFHSDEMHLPVLRRLRRRAGASSLATESHVGQMALQIAITQPIQSP